MQFGLADLHVPHLRKADAKLQGPNLSETSMCGLRFFCRVDERSSLATGSFQIINIRMLPKVFIVLQSFEPLSLHDQTAEFSPTYA